MARGVGFADSVHLTFFLCCLFSLLFVHQCGFYLFFVKFFLLDYTFCITYGPYGPKNRPNYDGRGGRGRGWVSLSLSGVASGGVGSPRGTPPRAPVSVYAARTHAHGCTRDGPATRRRRRSTATAGDGRRWRATAGDGRRRHRWSRLWGEQEVRGAVPRAGLGLAPLPRGDSEAVHEPCKSRRPSARRRTCPDGRWSNAEWPG